MKYIYMFLLIFSCLSYLNGQKQLHDVIYLKNGSIIHGTILEQIPNVSIKIETTEKKLFVFKFEEIEKITKEEIKLDNNFNIDKPGYQGNSEFCFTFIGSEKTVFKLNGINGYRFNPFFSIGVGTGIWLDYSSELGIIPLFLDLRVNFMNKKTTPYMALGGGHLWGFADFDGIFSLGNYANLSFGVAFHSTRKGKYRGAYNLGLDFMKQSE